MVINVTQVSVSADQVHTDTGTQSTPAGEGVSFQELLAGQPDGNAEGTAAVTGTSSDQSGGSPGADKKEDRSSEPGTLEISLFNPAACLLILQEALPAEGAQAGEVQQPQAVLPGVEGHSLPAQEAQAEIADILEGMTQRDGTEAAFSLPAQEDAGDHIGSAADDALTARMPVILDKLSTARQTAVPESSNPYALENANDATQQAGGQSAPPGEQSDTAAEETGAVGKIAVSQTEKDSAGQKAQSGLSGDNVKSAEHSGETRTEHTEREPVMTFVSPERASVSGDTVQKAVETAVTQLTEDLVSYEPKGHGQLELQLEPESLGKLTVRLAMGEHGLTAQIRTADPEVRGVLAGQIQQLVDALQDRGVSVNQVDVLYTGMGQQDMSGRQSGGEESRRNGSSRRIRAAGEEEPAAAAVSFGVLAGNDGENSSVEYRA